MPKAPPTVPPSYPKGPKPLPPVKPVSTALPPRRRKAKKAASKPASKGPIAKPTGKPVKSPSASKARHSGEVDPSTLTAADLAKRCKAIYALERAVEKRTEVHELAKRGLKSARDGLNEAKEMLAKEIHDQRFGPGPLFSPDGKGAAKGASK